MDLVVDLFGLDLVLVLWLDLRERGLWRDGRANVRLLDDPTFIAKKAQGLAAIESKISRLSPEYQALVHALRFALERHATAVRVFSDSDVCNCRRVRKWANVAAVETLNQEMTTGAK